MRHAFAAGSLMVLAFVSITVRAAQAGRSEIPVREVVLSDGERRYGVPIKVGNTAIEAGLDSGSTGLRILPGVLADGDAKGSGDGDRYSYGSGTQFAGDIGTGTLAVGVFSAPATMQLITTVECRSDTPRCPASRVARSQFGIQGSGLPGEGFKAILGVNMAKADVASPFIALGASRWIIELPRPGSGEPGKIILDPTDDEVQGFAMMPILAAFRDQKGGFHDSVEGCILNNASKEKACGALIMDTGAPGMQVVNSDLGSRPWPTGTAATFGFYGKDERLVAEESFTVGLRSHASHLAFEKRIGQPMQIFSGLSPYFAFDVLYDPAAGMVGLKPRPLAPDAPAGRLVAQP